MTLEGKMMRQKPRYFGHIMRSNDTTEKEIMLGKFKGIEEDEDHAHEGEMESMKQHT